MCEQLTIHSPQHIFVAAFEQNYVYIERLRPYLLELCNQTVTSRDNQWSSGYSIGLVTFRLAVRFSLRAICKQR